MRAVSKVTKKIDGPVHVFKPRARLMLLLGDELIRDAGIAVFELVKNAYDADATKCDVVLNRVNSEAHEASVTIEDDGSGMDMNTIVNVWLEPGTDNRKRQREERTRTPVHHRLPLGEKGVGRFAVHKLGHRVELITRAAGNDEILVSINWQDFSEAAYVEDVPVHVVSRKPEHFIGESTGTRITVSDLRGLPWTRRQIRELHRAVTSICSPFHGPETFRPNLAVETETGEDFFEGLLTAGDVIEQAPFRFRALIDGDTLDYEYEFEALGDLGRVDARRSNKMMQIRSPDRRRQDAVLTLPKDTIGIVYLEFFVFDRSPKILKRTATDVRGVRNYLNENGGVRVYRDGVRVYDFGEPGNDWLNLGGSRVNDPSVRIGNNQIIGAVRLSYDITGGSALVEKTNREGFVENDAYRVFREAVQFAVQQAATERNIDKERIRIAYAETQKREPVTDDLEDLRKEIAKRDLTPELGPVIERIESQYRSVTERLLAAAGAGLNLSVVMHEVEKGIMALRTAIEGDQDRSTVLAQVRQLSEMVDSLAWLTRKAERGDVPLPGLIDHAVKVWQIRFRHHNIDVQTNYAKAGESFTVQGYRRLLLSALMNLADNAIYWLRSKATDRKLYIGLTRELGNRPAIVVADNGPGFIDAPEYVTEPFVTRKPDGMGLGLYISREVMQQHDGVLMFPDRGDVSLPPGFTGAVVVMRF